MPDSTVRQVSDAAKRLLFEAVKKHVCVLLPERALLNFLQGRLARITVVKHNPFFLGGR